MADEPRLVFLLGEFALGNAPRLPVAITGQWVKLTADGKQVIKITLDDLNAMRANFAKKGNGEVNVDYDHKSETGAEIADPIPSAGRITSLMAPEEFTDAQGVKRYIVWGAYEPTDRARQLIAAKEYRYTSPAFGEGIDKATGKAQGTTLSTVALTNRPVIEQMPEVRLSDPGFSAMEAQQVHVDGNLSGNAGKGGKMKTLKIAKQADGENAGKHLVFDGDELMGHIPEDALDAHAKENGLGAKPADKEACHAAELQGRTALLAEIGAEGKTAEEVKQILRSAQDDKRKGADGNAAAEKKPESVLLSETIDDKGKIVPAKLDELVDSGKVKPSASRRALAAETRVEAAFKAGKIKPTDLKRATLLCLSDDAAFRAFIEDAKPVVALETQGVARAAEDGAKPATYALGEMIAKRMAVTKESRDIAELNVIRTDEGLKLWNAAMAEGFERIEGRK